MSSDTLVSFWPHGLDWSASRHQYEGPCPFCNPASKDGDPILEGEDRFFISPGVPGGTCRQCNAAGRGPRGNGWYSDGQIAARFGRALGEDYKPPTSRERTEKPLSYKYDDFRTETHVHVDYTFWLEKYNWPRELVDDWSLGFGTLREANPNQHLIPMRVERYGREPFPAWYYASRGNGKERLPGSSKPYMGIIEKNPISKVFAITEGDTDFVTASYLGFENVGTVFGNYAWTDDKADLILEKGYERIYVLGDGDDAGQSLVENILRSFTQRGITDIWVLDWTDVDFAKDLTDLLKTKSRDESRLWVTARLVQSRDQHPQYNTKERIKQELISLEELRGEGEKSILGQIRLFVNNYDALNRGKGESLHLQAPPGAGKTHALIRVAEELAQQRLAAYDNEKEYLQAEIERLTAEYELDKSEELGDALRKARNRLENHSMTAVAWYGQYKHGWEDVLATGANSDLWFNYEARNEENCQNYKRAMELGAKHHDIGYFCRTACPFFQNCQYIAQEKERKAKPITFFRHQHLMAGMEQDYSYLTVVDEFAGTILENNPVQFKPEHIYAHRQGWQLELISFDMAEAIEQFAEASRAAIASNAGAPMALPDGSTNMDYILSGAKFLEKLDSHCQTIAKMPLVDLLERIDSDTLHKAYQPNFAGAQDAPIHLRCLPQFYEVVVRELPDYLDNPHNQYPSCLHCVAGQMEIYAPDRIKTRHRTPMVIADATGIPVLYRAMFSRTVHQYSPQIRNPNARTEVIVNNDWTKGSMNAQIGAALRDRKQLLTETVTSLEGHEFDPASLPVSASLYQSKMVENAINIIKKLSEKHNSLLVVTHKDLREVLESHTQALFTQSSAPLVDKIAWAHYGSVRGTNKYEHYEAVALLGCFRIPYNILWRRIQMWAWMLGIKEYIAPDTVQIKSTYDTASFAETEHRSFLHQFAQSYVDMIEKGELQQCAARIRPHSTQQEKFVYCFANRPALQFIDHLSTHNNFMKTTAASDHYELYEFMKKEFVKEQKFPAYRTIRTEWHVGTDTVKRLRDQITKELSA